MMDSATGWTEIRTKPSVWTIFVSNQVELAWLICYSLHSKVIVDMGK